MILKPSLAPLALAAIAFAALSSPCALGQATTAPVPRDDNWMKRHNSINAEVLAEPSSQLLFIGDSITQAWNGPGKAAWATFAEFKPLNLGIGGDRTQHVLWRLENGNLSGLKPKLAVLMIGTNNSGGDSAEDITAGVTAIVNKLRSSLPETKILLLAIFPRGEKPNPQREKISTVNKAIANLDDQSHVHFLDIGDQFLAADGTIAKDIMPDFLHLSPKAYALWAEAITPKVKELTR